MKSQNMSVYSYYALCGLFLIFGFTLLETGPEEVVEKGKFILCVYWVVHVIVALFIYIFTTNFVIKRLQSEKLSLQVCFIIGSLLSSLLFTLIALILEIPFQRTNTSLSEVTSSYLSELLSAGLESLVFWGLINLQFLKNSHDLLSKNEVKNEIKPSKGKEKLKEKVGNNQKKVNLDGFILAQSEANYVRIYYDNRSELLLLSLKNLMTYTEVGLRVHRSYFINKKHIKEKFYDGQKPYLTMTNGFKVPIGRKYFKEANAFLKQ